MAEQRRPSAPAAGESGYFQGVARNRWLAGQIAAAALSALVFFNLGGQLGRFGWRAPF